MNVNGDGEVSVHEYVEMQMQNVVSLTKFRLGRSN